MAVGIRLFFGQLQRSIIRMSVIQREVFNPNGRGSKIEVKARGRYNLTPPAKIAIFDLGIKFLYVNEFTDKN